MKKQTYIWWMTTEELVSNFRGGLINAFSPTFRKLPDYIGNLLCWIHEVGYRSTGRAFSFTGSVDRLEIGDCGAEYADKIGLAFDEKHLSLVQEVIGETGWRSGFVTDVRLNRIAQEEVGASVR